MQPRMTESLDFILSFSTHFQEHILLHIKLVQTDSSDSWLISLWHEYNLMQIAVCNRTQTWLLQWGWGWSVSISTPFIEYLHMQTQINGHYICSFFIIIYAEVTDSSPSPHPTPIKHPYPNMKRATCISIQISASRTHTHTHTHSKDCNNCKFIICHSLPPDKCHIFYLIYATISCSQSQSQNKLIHKTNETDGEVDKTGAEDLQLLLQLILHKLHSNEQPYCAGVLTFNVRSFMTSSIFSSCCIKRSWNENKTDFINMHVPLWGTCADTSSTAKSTNPVKHLAKRQDR